MEESDNNMRETLTVSEVGRILGCGRNQAYLTVKAHGLAINLGRKLVVPRVRLERFLEGK